MVSGLYAYVNGAGWYEITGVVDATHAFLLNLGLPDNIDVGSIVPTDSEVVISGSPNSSSSSFGAPLLIVGEVTLTNSDTWSEFTQGPYTIHLPEVPTVGLTFELTHISGDLSGLGQITLDNNGAGYLIDDPQTPTLLHAESVTMRTNAVTYRFRFDGSAMKCVN
jgi:hypothetical protein